MDHSTINKTRTDISSKLISKGVKPPNIGSSQDKKILELHNKGSVILKTSNKLNTSAEKTG